MPRGTEFYERHRSPKRSEEKKKQKMLKESGLHVIRHVKAGAQTRKNIESPPVRDVDVVAPRPQQKFYVIAFTLSEQNDIADSI
jgi:hypothetical protein